VSISKRDIDIGVTCKIILIPKVCRRHFIWNDLHSGQYYMSLCRRLYALGVRLFVFYFDECIPASNNLIQTSR
jgi:hypothetical protein